MGSTIQRATSPQVRAAETTPKANPASTQPQNRTEPQSRTQAQPQTQNRTQAQQPQAQQPQAQNRAQAENQTAEQQHLPDTFTPSAKNQAAAQPRDNGWKADWANVPQLRGEKLRNGETWCGPAVGTTLARMLGTRSETRNHELLHEFVGKHTTKEGTTPLEMTRMIQSVGGKVDGQILAGRYDDKELDGIFQKDNKVVAQIGLSDPKSGKVGSHWMIVHGKNADGSFSVKDPLRGEYTMKPEQLREAVDRAPGLGGMLIPVGRGSGTDSAPVTESQFVSYFRPTGGAGGGKGANIPTGTSAQQLAGKVEDQLSSGDLRQRRAGQQQLEALEHSSNSVARQAFDAIMRLFGKRPGGGQPIKYGGYGEN